MKIIAILRKNRKSMDNVQRTINFKQIVRFTLSIIHYPLSIIHYPLSIIHYPLSIIRCYVTFALRTTIERMRGKNRLR
jgi:hypothetical protein